LTPFFIPSFDCICKSERIWVPFHETGYQFSSEDLQDLNADKTFNLMKELSGGLKASIIIGKAKSKTGAGTHPHRHRP
jgi:hypothetical protein